MPPPTITVRFAPRWIGCGVALHAVLAVIVGTVGYRDGVPIWFMGPSLFGIVGLINMVLTATGVYPYLRVTPQRVSYRSMFNGHMNHVDLVPGDTVVATAEGLYRRPWGGQWERLGAIRALADSRDWRNLQYWTGGLEPQQGRTAAAPAQSESAQAHPAAIRSESPASAVIQKRPKRQRNVY
jgi:hypothetical protein